MDGKRWIGKYYNPDGNEEFPMKNGRWKGKEIDFNGNLFFEGEYICGKRYGKGKEFYDNSKLKFEREYLNGKRNGKGIEFNKVNGTVLFKREYLKEKRYDGG